MRLPNVCTGCLVAGAAIVLAACGGGPHHSQHRLRTAGPTVVDIYSSLPMRGADAAEALALVNGIKLALYQDRFRAGRWRVHYTTLDDSAPGGGWDAAQTAANARRVAADPNAIYYIGDSDSAASEISIPVLNQADVPQVSPTDTYIGLTRSFPGSRSHEPEGFYPTGTRTFLRLMPSDTVQADALLLAMRQAGCKQVAVANDGKPYGTALTSLFGMVKSGHGVQIVNTASISSNPAALRRYAQTLRSLGAGCLLFAGADPGLAVQLSLDVNAALPNTRIFGSNRVCSGAWTNPALGGVPAKIAPRIECTLPTLAPGDYPPEGRAFFAAYEARYGDSDPNVFAIYGYEAMKLGLDTIERLGPDGDRKSVVRAALFGIHGRRSVLGTYGFDAAGDTTLRYYGLYRVGTSGNPVFVKTLSPPRTV